MAFGKLSLKGRALRYLAQREHSRAELERKLMPFARAQAVEVVQAAQATQATPAAQATQGASDGRRGSCEAVPHADAHPDRVAGGVAGGFDAADDAQGTASSARQLIANTLDDLAGHGLLSDARCADAVVTSKAARLGVHRLKQTLQSKGLAPELIETSLQRVSATEYSRAVDLWRRRFGTPPADAAERGRQARYLAGRGFASDIIRRVLQARDDD